MTSPRRLLALVLLTLAPLAGGCASNQAYVEWRPGLSSVDFSGLYELSSAEYNDYAERGEANLLFDRYHGIERSPASSAMAELGERLTASAPSAPGEVAIAALTEGGTVTFVDGRGERFEASVDWFATTADRGHAALLAGTRLAVVIDRASISIELGSLLGPELGGQQFTMLVDDGELTVFALPEIGGYVAPNEPGYVLSFTLVPGAKQPWEIGVGRVEVVN